MTLLFALPGLLPLLGLILIMIIVLGVLYYLATLVPEPLRRWAIGAVIVVGALMLIWLIAGLTGAPIDL